MILYYALVIIFRTISKRAANQNMIILNSKLLTGLIIIKT